MQKERWTISQWQDFLKLIFRPEHIAFLPHKIFRWNEQGVYQDCYFPIPCLHLLGGEKLLGASLNDILPTYTCRVVKNGLLRALRTERGQSVTITLSKDQTTYLTTIQMVPYCGNVFGFITDYYPSGFPVVTASYTHPALQFLNSPGAAHGKIF
jgi:hypothetical protein